MASAHGNIRSPACAAAMAQPRILPRLVTRPSHGRRCDAPPWRDRSRRTASAGCGRGSGSRAPPPRSCRPRRSPDRCRSRAGSCIVSTFTGSRNEGAADHETGVVVRDVGELWAAARPSAVADGVDAPVPRAQADVDGDAAACRGRSRRPRARAPRCPAAARPRREDGCLRRSRAPRRNGARRRPPSSRCSIRSILIPVWSSTPSLRSARSSTAAISGSSRGQEAGGLRVATSAPSRRKACASSRPDRPAADDDETLRPLREDRTRSRW